ncbi:MAG TPA: hypothetical protein VN452_08540 [Longilinea sp.]|nr:hypothetical protein [Longilinea sp.]
MNTEPLFSSTDPTADQSDSISEAFELALSRFFALTQAGGRIRGTIFWILFFTTWLLTAFWYHPWSDGSIRFLHLQLDPTSSIIAQTLTFLDHLFGFLLAGDTLSRLITFFVPAWLAIEIAAIYLMDIFELPKSSIGREFISRAAFAFPQMEMLVINNEALSRKQLDLPVIRIGGPSLVQVNVEFVAVFERINGAFHPISPNLRIQKHTRPFPQKIIDFLARYFSVFVESSSDNPNRPARPNGTLGKQQYLPAISTLDGFERLRQIIDLRDQTACFSIEARTNDGILINVKDLRLIFSVWRGVDQTSLGRPYPFRRQAVYSLTYQNSLGELWSFTMQRLVQEELIRFISEHTLGELLAAIGEPEIQRQVAMENAIHRKIWSNRRYVRSRRMHSQPLFPHRPKNYHKSIPLPFREHKHARQPRFQRFYSFTSAQFPVAPNFIPRPQLSNFFRNFANGFPERARIHGVRLEWIDIGSFSTNEQVILNQHIEAWRITAENLVRGSSQVLDELRRQSTNQEITSMLQSMPILSFVQLQKQKVKTEDAIFELVGMYSAVLKSARENLRNQGKPMPVGLENAFSAIRTYQADQYKTRRGHTINS